MTLDFGSDPVGPGQESVLEGRAVRNRRVRGCDAPRVVEVAERLLRDTGEHLTGPTACDRAFLDDHDAVGLPDRGEDGVEVQRPERPQVDHLDGHAVALERVRSLRDALDQRPLPLLRQFLISVDGSYTNQVLLKALPPRTTLIGRIRQDTVYIGGVTDIGTIIWVECPYETGGHFSEDSIYAEVLDPETLQPVPEGEPGELVMSDFVDTCAPLIRYRVKDLVTWTSEPCACGRTLGRMPEGVIGRVDDMITVRSANIYPSAIDAIVKGMPDLNGEYQIVVDRPKGLDELTIRVEPADATVNPADIVHSVQTRMRLNSATAVTVEVVAAGSLPRFVYKASRVVDKRKGQTEQMMFEKAAAQGRS